MPVFLFKKTFMGVQAFRKGVLTASTVCEASVSPVLEEVKG
jgi:hypothetical protein